jgi:hypothetical protein
MTCSVTVLRWFSAAAPLAALLGCGSSSGGAGTDGGGDAEVDAGPPLAPEIGTGDHSPASVTLTSIAGSSDELQAPTDLAFNPLIPDDLWVTNYDDDSVVIIHDATSGSPNAEYRKDWYGDPTGFPASHFMPNPTSIAFGRDETSSAPEPAGTGGIPGTFATCGDNRNDYDDSSPPNDFMGPALWPSDLSIFAERPLTPLGSHIDMLHCSPYCMGLAHETANIYWAFDGHARDPDNPYCTAGGCRFLNTSAIVRYDFHNDHGPGNDDHSDGEARQYVTTDLRRVSGVPSHLIYDTETQFLYIADTGHGRIATLDTTSGSMGVALDPPEPMVSYNVMNDAVLNDVVPAGGDLEAPSGLELYNGLLYVTDHATGLIHAYDLAGTRVNYLDTGRGVDALAGMAFGSDGKLYLVDMETNEVLRIDP